MTKTNADPRETDALDEYTGTASGTPDVNFAEIPESSVGTILPPGTYSAVVIDVEKKVGPNGLYYNWRFGITDDPYQDVNVWRVTSLAPKAADGTFKTLQIILGAAIPRGNFTLEDYKDRFLGRPVRLKTKTREYPAGSGILTNDVDRILPPTPSTGEGESAPNKLF